MKVAGGENGSLEKIRISREMKVNKQGERLVVGGRSWGNNEWGW